MADENTTTPENTDQNLPDGVTVETGSPAMTATADEARQHQQEQAEAKKLAGKFDSADDLEKAYLELQKKLGAGEAEEEGTEAETNDDDGNDEEDGDELSPYGKAVGEAIKAAEIDLDAAKNTFNETGELGEGDYEKFDKAGFPREMVDAYLNGVKQGQAEATTVTEAEIAKIKSLAGGDEGFSTLQQHIAADYSPDEVAAYNEAISSGDVAKAQAAVQQAVERYNAEIGTEGNLLGGGKPPAPQGYKSEAEMIADMKKPEYKKDPAFRAQVEKKIAQASFFQTR